MEGIRDIGLLQSAIAVPYATFGGSYLHRSFFEMAAAYMFHIIKNHPFYDGSKRTGAVAAIVFLGLNGFDLKAEEPDFERLVRDVAEDVADKSPIASFLETNM